MLRHRTDNRHPHATIEMQLPPTLDGAGPPPQVPFRRLATIGTPPGLGLRPTLLAASPHLHFD